MKNKMIDYGKENTINLKLLIALVRSGNENYRSTIKLLKQYHLTVPQFGVLEVLYHLGDMCINDIISKTLSTSGNMTVVIKNLEKAKLINKIQNEKDKRKFLIRITTKGKKLIEEIFPKHLLDLQKGFSRLEYDEKMILINSLKKLNGVQTQNGEN